MKARSIWQGTLKIKGHELPVKLYSAVRDQSVHFHLLHRRDRTRVEQRMVDSRTGKTVSLNEARKAFEVEPGVFVIVTSDDLEKSVPKPSRDVVVSRFVAPRAIDPRMYDRPYYLGPGESAARDYSALVRALEKSKRAGIATWVMRKHSYVGALFPQDGYLMLITLRHTEEVVALSQLPAPAGATFSRKETDLAERLIEALAGRFDPDTYHDEYQQRVHELIDAKRRGKTVSKKRAPRRRETGSLSESLEQSLKGLRPGRPK